MDQKEYENLSEEEKILFQLKTLEQLCMNTYATIQQLKTTINECEHIQFSTTA